MKSTTKGTSQGSRVSSPLTRRSGRFSIPPLNPNRTVERELAEADRSESDPEDQLNPTPRWDHWLPEGEGAE
jgi:hypothetical protein